MFVLKSVNPVAFNLFGIPVFWYGIFMALAIFVAIVVSNFFFNRANSLKYKDKIIEYAALIIFSGILGARLYYCVLNFSYYALSPAEILNVREGGLSIHGAILGGVLSLLFISRRTKFPVLRYLDAISTGTILGQAIGRWGNFFNSEAYGFPVKSQLWGVFIPESRRLPQYSDFSLYHPAFLYESLLDLAVFFILSRIYLKYSKNNGVTFCCYLVFYSVVRFFIEFVRVDSAFNVGTVPIAVIVSVILFFSGICGLVYINLRTNR